MSLVTTSLNYAYDSAMVLKDISLATKKGEISTIIGPNGVGKSTLLRCLANIYQPQSGSVYLNGAEIVSLNPQELAKLMGYVPQTQLDVFSLTVYEGILLGRKPYIRWSVGPKDLKMVDQIINTLGLEHLAERSLNTLSGGERQKVAIARALAQEPSVLLLDEPTSSLDMGHQLELMEIVTNLAKEHKSTVVMVLHDLNLALRFSERLFLLSPAGLYAQGRPQDVATIEHLKQVYGVEVELIETTQGVQVIPLKLVPMGETKNT